MSWRPLATAALLALATALAGLLALPAGAERAQSGNLRLLLDGDFSPHALPRHRPVPIAVRFDGSIETADGSHPPALRRLVLELNRNGRYSAAGLPTCRSARLQSVSTEEALHRCRGALVGRGSFRAAIRTEPRGSVAARGRLLVFNSRRDGRPALALHLFAAAPIRLAVVLPLALRRRAAGAYGTVLATRLPSLANGQGSITDIHLGIGRTYRHRGRRRGLISASCAAPAGFEIALFPFARARLRFADGTGLQVPLTRSCRVQPARRP
ncbi:MAG: hypothetical protein R2725_12495 [Solirubrobacterales bacterium]